MKKKTKPMIFKLQTKDWNKLPRKDQDKAILFIIRILIELAGNRKHGYDPEFFAQFP